MTENQNTGLNSGLSSGGDASIFGTNELSDIFGIVKTKLQQAASSPDLFSQVFGDKANTAEIQAVRSHWSVGDFSQLPSIQILPAANFSNAVGAYANSSQTVYLSDALFHDSAAPLDSFSGAAGVLVEETFHWLDSLVGTDTQGDEGELGKILVFGESVSNSDLTRIKQEDDRGFITINGQSIFVEQAGTNVTIEAFGNTKLLKDESKLLFAQVSNNTPISIKYNGLQIYTSIFAGWETIAVETVGGQNQVLWKNAATNSIIVWAMDSNWNYLSSGSTLALNSGGALTQETNFGVDINGDSFVGAVNLEWQGNTKLVKDASNSLYAQVSNNTPVSIKYNGSQVYTNIFAGWETLAVETVGGQNQVLWKNAGTNTALVWNMDSNWNYLSTSSTLILNSTAALTQETNFSFDLNGNGYIGSASVTVESQGNTKLIKDGANLLSAQLGNNTTVSIKYNGSQVYTNIFAGWETLAVETVGGQNQVLWKNAGTNSAIVWSMDSNWNYLSASSTLALNSAGAFTQETNFNIDLNVDGYVGTPSNNIKILEGGGNTSLIKNASGFLSVGVGSTQFAIKYNGSQIYTGIFAGWEALAVETVGGQNQVLWKNAATNSALVWNMDSNWNYLSSSNTFALNSINALSQELNFGPGTFSDLNGDGFWGIFTNANSFTYANAESFGNTKLVKDQYTFLSAQVGNNTPIAIKYNGSQIYTGMFAGWETVAVETVGGQNQVLWKNAATGTLLLWNMDSNWSYLSSGSPFALNSGGALTQETNVGIDLNGDSFVGAVNLEWKGNTKLVKDASNSLYAQLGDNTPVSMQYNGSQIYTGIFAGWETVAVETVGGQNQVLWKNAGTNSSVVWTMDSNWSYLYSGSTFALNSAAALTQETNFSFDLNGDGIVGILPTITISPIDNSAGEVVAGQTQNLGQFALNRTGNVSAALTVGYTVSGTATNGTDYSPLSGTVTFAAGNSNAVININVIDDADFEGNETIVLNLVANSAYTLGATTSSTVTIADNDLPTITVVANDSVAGEMASGQAQNPGQFTFSRTGSTANALTVNFGLGGTAISGSDYSALPTSVTFAAGASTAVVNINVTDDAVVEGSETVFLQLLANAAYTLGATTSATTTIADNDVANITVTSPNGGNSLQRGQAVTIQWNDNIPDNVRVDLYKNNIFYRNITTSTLSNGSLSWTVPMDVLLGTDYKIRVAKTDGTLIDFSDNNFSITGTPNVDLKGYSFTSVVGTVGAGTTQNLYYNIQNSGIDHSGAFRVGFYLSTDTIFTMGDRFLGYENISSLAGGSLNGTYSKFLTMPAAGDSFYNGDKTYYIGMIVDDLNAVTETNESNNSGQKIQDDYTAVTVNGTVTNIDTTISWDGQNAISSFGESDTATYGQTFTVSNTNNVLNSFTFYLDDFVNPDTVDFAAYIMAWDGTKATGPIIYTSNAQSTTGANGFETFTFNTGGLNLTAGQNYVAFLNASNFFDGVIGNGRMGYVGNDVYAGGSFVYLNNGNNFNSLTTSAWTNYGGDLAFKASFTGSASSFITVSSPNGGESFQAGSSYNITWSDNIGENVKIDLYKSGAFYQTIFSSTLSDGSEIWTLPSNLASGSDYQIRINSISNSNIYDWGNNYFTVAAAPFITVSSPNGGESFQAGSSYNITWSDNIGENVKVDLYKSGAFYQTIFSSTLSDGIETWTVASNLASGSDYQIRISSVNNSNIYDWGNNYFTINPLQQPDLVITSQYAPSSATIGSTVNISGYAYNQGTATAGTNYVRYWLSDDATLDTSTDRFLGYNPVNTLAAGSSEYDAFSFTYDASWGAGTKYIFFEADGYGYVTESNESNNVAYKTIFVNPVVTDPGNTLGTASLQSSVIFSRNEQVSSSDTNDFYKFSVNTSGIFTASLTGLTGDADIRLIRDNNNNGQIDQGEILAWQWERGTANESIRDFLSSGDYFLQVMNYNNQTANYSLSTNFTTATTDNRQFSLDISWGQGSEVLSSAMRTAVQEAADFWENVISYTSFSENQNLIISVGGSPQEWSNTRKVLASAGIASYGYDANGHWMPTSGSSNINNNSEAVTALSSNIDYFRRVMIHEFGHVLGLVGLQGDFVDPLTALYKANSYSGWAYGELLGTYQQTAIPLTTGVGEGSDYYHWREETFGNEIMTHEADYGGMPISQMTIAALRDLGWNVNYGAAEAYSV